MASEVVLAYGDLLTSQKKDANSNYNIKVFGGLTISCFSQCAIAHVVEFCVDHKTKELLLWDSEQLSVAELFKMTSLPQVFHKDDVLCLKAEIYEYYDTFTSQQVEGFKQGKHSCFNYYFI